MKIQDYRGHELHQPTSGGKAGTGHNKTSTVQVRVGNCIVKQFRYEVRIYADKHRAIQKAKEWIDARAEDEEAKPTRIQLNPDGTWNTLP